MPESLKAERWPEMKKATIPEEKRSLSHGDIINKTTQCARLLKRLNTGSVDTLTARSELSILHPAARVQELKDQGHKILKHTLTLTDDQGQKHHGVALYYLSTNPPVGVTA